MASPPIFALLIAILVLATRAGATEHMVGGDRGWVLDVDYKAWAEGREFFVGDTLVFRYLRGDHNVIEVDEAGFRKCVAPSGAEELISGNDVVPLTTPGKKWYICGIPTHCDVSGQKLAITVLPESSRPAPPPPPSVVEPTSSAPCVTVFRYYVPVVSIIAILMF